MKRDPSYRPSMGQQGEWVQGPYGWQWQAKQKKPMSALAALTIAGAVVAVLAWGAIFFTSMNDKFTVRGSMIVRSECETYGSGYSDISEGTQVTVKVDDKTVAVGQLGEGIQSDDDSGYLSVCAFPITIPDVPGGEDFYEVEVGHRGGLTYGEADLRDGIQVTLG